MACLELLACLVTNKFVKAPSLGSLSAPCSVYKVLLLVNDNEYREWGRAIITDRDQQVRSMP